MEIVLYSTNCPQCKMLEMALKKKGLNYSLVIGAEEIRKRGYRSAPILEKDGSTMSFAEAVRWVNSVDGSDVHAG